MRRQQIPYLFSNVGLLVEPLCAKSTGRLFGTVTMIHLYRIRTIDVCIARESIRRMPL